MHYSSLPLLGMLLSLSSLLHHSILSAQYERPPWDVGPDMGAHLSFMNPLGYHYSPYGERVGSRLGLYVQYNSPHKWSIRSGLWHTTRGLTYMPIGAPEPLERYEWNGINTCAMVVYSIIPEIDIAIGMDFNTVWSSDVPELEVPQLQVGLRMSTGFYVTPQLRFDFYQTILITKMDLAPDRYSAALPYQNILIGMGCSYSLFPPIRPALQQEPPPLPWLYCPRF